MPDFGSRLRDAREALGLGQTSLAERCGVTARSQRNYEAGERSPDAEYLAALAEIGVDVLFVLTGKRDPRVQAALTAEEQTVLSYFKEASKEAKRAALGALLGAPLAAQLGGMSSSGAGAVQVGHGAHYSTGPGSQHSSGAGAMNIGSMGAPPVKRRGK